MVKISELMRKMSGSQRPSKAAKAKPTESTPPPKQNMQQRSSVGKKRLSLTKIANQKKNQEPETKPVSDEKPSIEEQQGPRRSFIFTKSRRKTAEDEKEERASWDIESVNRALKTSKEEQHAVAESLYTTGLSLAGEIVERTKNDELIELNVIVEWLDELIKELQIGNDDLLSLAFRTEAGLKNEKYIHRSMVNVAILAIRVGMGKKCNKSKLLDVGLVGFFHDIGVVKILDIVTKEDLLTEKDRERIREHPRYSMEILEKIEDLSRAVIQGVYQTHERLDGSGYPIGLDDLEKISELARVVAIVDVFEALTHNRPYRNAMMPQEALKYILEHLGRQKFEEAVLKILVNEIGLYPVGSWVVLSNKEIGKVIGLNIGQPIRPKVRIFFDEEGNPIDSKEPVIIDLGKNPLLSIARPLTEKEQKHLSLV